MLEYEFVRQCLSSKNRGKVLLAVAPIGANEPLLIVGVFKICATWLPLLFMLALMNFFAGCIAVVDGSMFVLFLLNRAYDYGSMYLSF